MEIILFSRSALRTRIRLSSQILFFIQVEAGEENTFLALIIKVIYHLRRGVIVMTRPPPLPRKQPKRKQKEREAATSKQIKII
jgi:hypothetical protein